MQCKGAWSTNLLKNLLVCLCEGGGVCVRGCVVNIITLALIYSVNHVCQLTMVLASLLCCSLL